MWYLVDAEERTSPTFQIPPQQLRSSLRKGDHCKLIFETDDLFEKCRGERMWVEITNVLADGHYLGLLKNYPVVLADSLEYADAVEFKAHHIADVDAK